MKRHLYVKFLGGYLVFGVLGFLVIALFSSWMVERYLKDTVGEQMYNEAYLLAETFSSVYSGSEVDLEEVAPSIESVTAYMGATAWLMDRQGEIVYSSSPADTGRMIRTFSTAEFGQNHYITGTFDGYYSDPMLSVYAPVSGNYRTYGYVVLHMPLSTVLSSRETYLNIIYLTFLVIFALSLLLLAVFFWIVYRPLRKITAAARQFAEGHLDYRLSLRAQDEMGELAATLNYMAGELSKMEEYQRKFVSNVSHDFRSPLTSIKGYLEAMMDGTIPPELYDKYMSRVISETERLTKLTQETLALQSLESRGTFLELSDFDVNQVVKNVAETFEGICRPRGITFDLTFSSRSLSVHADLGKIQQVLYNLIDNAVKFSPDGSVIHLETSERYDKVFVSVRDSGVGIPRENQKKIWDRFYKSDRSRGKDKLGTGLGLSIVKEIIQAHGQTIDVISTVGVGSEFIFTLQKAVP